MVFPSNPYARPLVPNTQDPAAVDFRAFYPYTPNEVKHRKRTTSQQLKVLETVFKKDTKPNAQLRQELAVELNMTARGVQVWFQNRRAKEKSRSGTTSLAGKGPSSSALRSSSSEEESSPSVLVKAESASAEPSLVSEASSVQPQVASSRSPSTTGTPTSQVSSPPQLHVNTDTSSYNWDNNSPVDCPPDSAASYASVGLPAATSTAVPPTAFRMGGMNAGHEDLYSLRRGSLPVMPASNASLQQQQQQAPPAFDPMVRRCSVDASLQRLASHPFATLARAKNSALYGAGVGVTMPGQNSTPAASPVVPGGSTRYHPINNRLPYGYQALQRRGASSSSLSSVAQFGSQHATGTRRLSMDSRSARLAAVQRMHQSSSPSPLTPYNAVVRASLPESSLYSLAARPVVSPIPGPLPVPGFQFGAATSNTPSMASPSSADSERNSPDSLRSFSFGGEEDGQTSPSYDAYSSRFGSIASIATSESSINSAYYAELGGSAVDHTESREASCTPAQFLGMFTDLDVSNQVEHMQHCSTVAGVGAIDNGLGLGTAVVGGYPTQEEYVAYVGADGVALVDSDMQRQSQAFASPASTISPGSTNGQIPHAQDPLNMMISSSSELAFALESKQPDQKSREPYVNYNIGEHSAAQSPEQQQQQHEYFNPGQQYQQQQPAYPSYPFAGEMQSAQQHLDYGVYSSTGDYSDPMASVNVMDNGLQGVEAFVAYS